MVRTHAPAQLRSRVSLTRSATCLRARLSQEAVRESERRRFADPTLVDKVIELDAVWREGASYSAARRCRTCRVACRSARSALGACGCDAQRTCLTTVCRGSRLARSALQARSPEPGVQRAQQERGQAKDRAGPLGARRHARARAHRVSACRRRPRRTPLPRLLPAQRSTRAACWRRWAAYSACLSCFRRARR